MVVEQPAYVLLFQCGVTRMKFCMGQVKLQNIVRVNMSRCCLNQVDPFDVNSQSKKLWNVYCTMRIKVGSQ